MLVIALTSVPIPLVLGADGFIGLVYRIKRLARLGDRDNHCAVIHQVDCLSIRYCEESENRHRAQIDEVSLPVWKYLPGITAACGATGMITASTTESRQI